MEAWKNAWRKGFEPQVSDEALSALRDALYGDDPRLMQGATTTPPPMEYVKDWPVEAACAIGYCGWQGDGLYSVGEVEEYFARMCFEADKLLGEPAGCRFFLNTYDDMPREVMRRELLAEVEAALGKRVGQRFADSMVR